MNSKNNVIPENVKKIHLIAVCGTAMGALAAMLKDMGYQVTGSDQKVYPPMSEFLSTKHIHVNDGFNGDNITGDMDLVVVGNAVRKDNPEVKTVDEKGLSFCSMPQAVNHFIAQDKKLMVVTGTHGKTTTSSLLAWILFHAGLDPSYVIGGMLKNFNSNYRLGNGKYMVIEGDEYDTAFFDKGPKFLHYPPFAAILTGIEFDHADIFKDISSIKQAFTAFIEKISPSSLVLAYDDDTNIRRISTDSGCSFVYYGKDPQSEWYLKESGVNGSKTVFQLYKDGKFFGTFQTPLIGEHNLLNAMPVIAICHSIGIDHHTISSGLESFQGVKRRQEIRGVKNGVTVMDDFAHHPTAVRETIRAVKPFYPHGRVIAVFEPRTNTSMRNIFQDIYPLSFDGADLICVRKPPLLEKIPKNERFSSEQLVQSLKKQGKDAYYFDDTEPIIKFLTGSVKSGDLVLIMSNGGFDNIHQRLLDAL
ncbi:MAG: UDP-N-acetylmuramate:L-alanyl-gamma-D-glutamyl-meso-diaminopimelate ligase [Desulfobacterales bacterium]|nr:UDP-N-acetylmuramate:L-alanyl-gamma-D-glutamyl-meso-diaminopimelate ligase [Desulfobacterales bacterium]